MAKGKKQKAKKVNRAKRFGISIYLSKPNSKISDCLLASKVEAMNANKVPLKTEIDGELYVYSRDSAPPDWVRYVGPALLAPESIANAIIPGSTNSAVLVLNHSKRDRCVIITFGHGTSLLNYENIELYFGRNVVLNSMEEDKILALKSRSYDSQPKHKDSQVSFAVGINNFEMDLQSEILQKMTGSYPLQYFKTVGIDPDKIGRSLTGSDALSFATSIPISEFSAVCEWVCREFESERYKDILPDIDSFSPIKSATKLAKLDSAVLKKISDGDIEDICLTVPEILDLSEFQMSSIAGLGRHVRDTYEFDDIDIEDLCCALEDSGKLGDLTIVDLKETIKLVRHSSTDSNRDRRFSMFRCLTAQIVDGSQVFALMDGSWFEIKKNFLDSIIRKLNKIVSTSKPVLGPFLDDIDRNEYGYNERQSKELGLQLFDQKFFARGKLEICDLLCSKTSKLIHVKRYSSSATLSHLFAQGYVSIRRLMEDDSILDKFVSKIDSRQKQVKESLTNRSATVCYAVLFKRTRSKREEKKIENLPVFSIVNLHKFVKDIETLGYKVKIQLVFSD